LFCVYWIELFLQAPAGGLGDRVPQKLSIFKSTQPEIKGQAKMKGIIWCHWWRFFIAVHTRIVLFQRSCCTMFGILGHSPLAPLPPNPPLSTRDHHARRI